MLETIIALLLALMGKVSELEVSGGKVVLDDIDGAVIDFVRDRADITLTDGVISQGKRLIVS